MKTLRERYRGVERRRGRMLDRIGRKQLKHLHNLEFNLAGDSSQDKAYLLRPPTLEDVFRREETGGEGGERRRRNERGGRRRKHIGKKLKRRKRRRRRWRRRGIQQCHQIEEEMT